MSLEDGYCTSSTLFLPADISIPAYDQYGVYGSINVPGDASMTSNIMNGDGTELPPVPNFDYQNKIMLLSMAVQLWQKYVTCDIPHAICTFAITGAIGVQTGTGATYVPVTAETGFG